MKAVLEFDLFDPEDSSEFKCIQKARDMQISLQDISNEIFRPARKHGYSDSKLNDLLDKSNTTIDEFGDEILIGLEIISILEDKFYRILEERGINLYE